jgi:hypothetical protein
MMESTILDALDRKGPLSEKKLWKRIVKAAEEKEESTEINQDQLQTQFSSAVEKLVEEHKIFLNGGSYCINKVSVKKRERTAESSGLEKRKKLNETEEEKEIENTLNQTTTEDTENSKKWNYPELWKNGEKFWREGTFDSEYLRTNPDG